MRPPILLLALTLASPALGQNYSCRIGTQPACLDYGDKICASSGMCVDRDAACFDQYQCNYEGFTCKSNVTNCVKVHDTLLQEHNTLVDDYNALVKKHKELATDFDRTITAARALKSNLDDIESCLIYASTLEDAKLCAQ